MVDAGRVSISLYFLNFMSCWSTQFCLRSEQTFLSDIALSIYEVVCVSRVVGLFTPPTTRLTVMQTISQMLKAMPEKKPLLTR